MKPFDKIKQQIDEDLHHKIPQKWKKIGNILVADFSQIDTIDKYFNDDQMALLG